MADPARHPRPYLRLLPSLTVQGESGAEDTMKHKKRGNTITCAQCGAEKTRDYPFPERAYYFCSHRCGSIYTNARKPRPSIHPLPRPNTDILLDIDLPPWQPRLMWQRDGSDHPKLQTTMKGA